MSFGVYILALIAGGVVIGVLVGLLVSRTSSEGMVPPIVLGTIAALVVGIFVAEFAGAQRIVGLPVALTVTALYVSRSGLSKKPAGHWVDRDRHGSDGIADGQRYD